MDYWLIWNSYIVISPSYNYERLDWILFYGIRGEMVDFKCIPPWNETLTFSFNFALTTSCWPLTKTLSVAVCDKKWVQKSWCTERMINHNTIQSQTQVKRLSPRWTAKWLKLQKVLNDLIYSPFLINYSSTVVIVWNICWNPIKS